MSVGMATGMLIYQFGFVMPFEAHVGIDMKHGCKCHRTFPFVIHNTDKMVGYNYRNDSHNSDHPIIRTPPPPGKIIFQTFKHPRLKFLF